MVAEMKALEAEARLEKKLIAKRRDVELALIDEEAEADRSDGSGSQYLGSDDDNSSFKDIVKTSKKKDVFNKTSYSMSSSSSSSSTEHLDKSNTRNQPVIKAI